MKQLLVIALTIVSLVSRAQQLLPEKDGKVVYEKIDSVPGVTQSDIYNRSRVWFVNTFRSAKAVLQLEDKESGQLIGKGNFKYSNAILLTPSEWTCEFTIQIDCRDSKARIKIYDISAYNAASVTAEYFNKYASHSKKHIKEINTHIEALVADYGTALTKTGTDNF